MVLVVGCFSFFSHVCILLYRIPLFDVCFLFFDGVYLAIFNGGKEGWREVVWARIVLGFCLLGG